MSTGEQHTRPDVKEIKDAYDYLFNSSHSLTKIKDAALGGRLFRAKGDSPGVAGRSLAWKLFLVQGEPLQTPADVISVSPLEALRALRKEYVDLLLERMRAPDGSYEDGLIVPGTGAQPPRVERSGQNLERNNPLSLDDENPWREWFASVELRKTISQDVERTFPDIGYFRDTEVQTQLTHILYVYSVMHPDVGYRQGMHELLAPLYYAIDYDSIDEASAPREDPAVKEFCARAWVAADAWALFSAVMRGVGRWYEWQETRSAVERTPLPSHVQLSASGAGVKPYVAPIVGACNRIQSTYLKMVDPELWKSMQSAGIEPQIYGIRWLRLLFTREFDMHDSMLVWDGLFACDPTFDLAQWICVAMLLRIRNKLIPSDYSEQLTFLLRYPSNPLSSSTPDPPTIHHARLLLRQALTLQMSPSPATGVSVIHENRNLLDIPVEVPAPAPPPPRRVTRGGQRGQSFSNASGPSSPGLPGSSGGSAGRSSHSRQQSTPMGLPEFFANRLLEKGESLGINKTVMNAMSELKRNLPDIATSLGRLPLTPPQHTSYAAYPLVDERPPAERPPWEPRSRFEMEREVSDLRALQKRLGDSVGWIVDTLLLDDDAEGEIDRAKSIRNRKREAVECLAR
ncbi:RabGAP/TBC [Wolfiporia cocos MD-104 SS10]|uniref:RabGAP/TBC n=1 Tax=Wolfiporia cocos (strain MD-104) TaxID=742152 RepID=A0A2H3J845_WOLCO|nr:RabGAP/TBC [Wolfiporia cocos MD-104 SS10]